MDISLIPFFFKLCKISFHSYKLSSFFFLRYAVKRDALTLVSRIVRHFPAEPFGGNKFIRLFFGIELNLNGLMSEMLTTKNIKFDGFSPVRYLIPNLIDWRPFEHLPQENKMVLR